jgi:hypothetical protein
MALGKMALGKTPLSINNIFYNQKGITLYILNDKYRIAKCRGANIYYSRVNGALL